jgi:hypothetical protein
MVPFVRNIVLAVPTDFKVYTGNDDIGVQEQGLGNGRQSSNVFDISSIVRSAKNNGTSPIEVVGQCHFDHRPNPLADRQRPPTLKRLLGLEHC